MYFFGKLLFSFDFYLDALSAYDGKSIEKISQLRNALIEWNEYQIRSS